MMHRCNSSQGNNMAGMGSCSCDLFHHNNQSNDRNYNQQYDYYHDQVPDMYNQFTSSSSVDCTLSLGTPSTRLSGYDYDYNYNYNYNDKIIQHENQYSSSTSNRNTTSRGALHNNTGNYKNDEDHLLARRRCANCDTTSTPLWRNGPRGPKSLCNACGIRFKKEERRARAASANSMNGISESQTQKMQCFNEFKFMDEDNEEPETGISFISSWHLNVADR